MSDLVVRPATVADLPAVARVRVRSWQAGYAGILPAEFLSSLDVDEDLVRRRQVFAEYAAVVDTLVAVRDGVVRGFTSFGPYRVEQAARPIPRGGEGEIYAIYVDPEYWGAGAGRMLLTEALKWLRERGFAPVRLWVLAGNNRARRFYAAAGFVADGATDTFSRAGFAAPEVRYTLR
jgi:ribosomal protein S18 acetylase RimI-like enzyme